VSRPALDLAEVSERLDCLTTAEYLHLSRAARRFAIGLNCGGDDLVHDAVMQALDGTRRCPRDVPVIVFLIRAMQSRASSLRGRAKTSPVELILDATGTDGRPLFTPASTDRNVEEWRLAKEDFDARVAALEALYADDELALLFLMADMDETPKEEIMAMNNLDRKGYDTVRRRMRRKMDGRFPHGWTS